MNRTNSNAIATGRYMLQDCRVAIADVTGEKDGNIETSVTFQAVFDGGREIVGTADNVPDAFAQAVCSAEVIGTENAFFDVIRGLNTVNVRKVNGHFIASVYSQFGDMTSGPEETARDALLAVAALAFNELWGRV